MRRLFLPVALLVAGCGDQGGDGIFERAQAGLAYANTGTIELHVTVDALVPIKRSAELQAGEVPLAKLQLARLARHPRCSACVEGLDCARADVDVEAALRDLKPVLPSLPSDLATCARPRWRSRSPDATTVCTGSSYAATSSSDSSRGPCRSR